jgi:predicted DNA-binding transcriptional regulator YafY
MIETSARLLRLLSLFQGRRYWSGAELADRLEVTARTLRRDVDKLRSLGYPIHSSAGVEGGYQLGAGATMPPLLLDDEEAVAVALGVRAAATGAIQGIEEASLRALSKIEQILPPRLGRRVAALQSMIVSGGGSRVRADARTLSVLASACRDRESVRFEYRDFNGSESTRQAEPYRLVNTWRGWYLVAWDMARRDWRTFRVDRIAPGVRVGVAFEPRSLPAKDLVAYVAQGVRRASPCHARVKLLVSAEAMAKRSPWFAGSIESIDDASCWFEATASTFENLAAYLAMLGVDFEVDGPAELVVELRRLGDRLGRAVGG